MFKVLPPLVALLCWNCSDGKGERVSGTTSETTNNISLTGRVLDPGGRALASSRLSLRQEDYLADTTGALAKNGPPEADAMVDSAGFFRIDSVPPGSYLLSIHADSGLARLVPLDLTGERESVDLGALGLAPVASYSGEVVQPSTHAGAAYVQVVGVERVQRVDSATGKFTLADMPAGPVSIRVTGASPALDPQVILAKSEPSLAVDLGSISLASFEDEDYALWPKSRPIGFDPAAIAGLGEAVSDFPLLVRLGPGEWDFAGSDGSDIRFSGAGGEHLRYRVQFWDSSASRAAVLVLLDRVPADTGFRITMHWGNSGATDWSKGLSPFGPAAGFAGVWHLDEDSPGVGAKGAFADASGADDPGDDHIRSPAEAGISGLAQRFLGADSIKAPLAKEAMLPKDAVTISAWVKTDRTDAFGATILSMGDNYGMRLNPDGEVQCFIATGKVSWVKHITKGAHIKDGLWHQITGRYDGIGISVWVDGVSLGTTGFKGSITYPLGRNFCIGTHGNGKPEYDFTGLIDEVRVDRRARSAAWITLRYANERPDSRLLRFE